MGKGEIARCEQFLLFPQCFQKACFPGASKGVIVWEWVIPFQNNPDPEKEVFENIVGKGENAVNQHFFLFLQCFLPIPREFLYLSYIYYTPFQRRGRYTVLALSIVLSLSNVSSSTFLSNHASQPLQTLYGALARGPTSCLLNSGQPVIYFLFPGSVHFLDYAFWDSKSIFS